MAAEQRLLNITEEKVGALEQAANAFKQLEVRADVLGEKQAHLVRVAEESRTKLKTSERRQQQAFTDIQGKFRQSQLWLQHFQATHDSYRQLHRSLQAHHEDLLSGLRSDESRLNELRRRNEEMRKEVNELREKSAAVALEKSSLMKSKTDLQGEMEGILSEEKRVSEEIESQRGVYRSHEKDLKDVGAEIGVLEERIKGLNTENSGLEERLALIKRLLNKVEEIGQILPPPDNPEYAKNLRELISPILYRMESDMGLDVSEPKKVLESILESDYELGQLQAESDQLGEKRDAENTAVIELEGRLSALRTTIGERNKTATDLSRKLGVLSKDERALRVEVDQIDAVVKDKQADHSSKRQEVERLRKETEAVQAAANQELAEKRERQAQLERLLSENRSVADLEEDLKGKMKQIEEARAEIARLEEACGKVERDVAAKKDQDLASIRHEWETKAKKTKEKAEAAKMSLLKKTEQLEALEKDPGTMAPDVVRSLLGAENQAKFDAWLRDRRQHYRNELAAKKAEMEAKRPKLPVPPPPAAAAASSDIGEIMKSPAQGDFDIFSSQFEMETGNDDIFAPPADVLSQERSEAPPMELTESQIGLDEEGDDDDDLDIFGDL